MSDISLFLRIRLGPVGWGALLLAAVVTAATAKLAISVNILAYQPARGVPLLELVPVLTGAVLAAACWSRLWWFERLGASRIRFHVLGAGLLVLALPVLMVVSAAPWRPVAAHLPDGVPWVWICANTLTVTAVALASTALFGPGPGWAVPLLGYAALVVAQHTLPGSPLAALLAQPRHPEPRWAVAALTGLVALAIQGWTCGATSWAWRRQL